MEFKYRIQSYLNELSREEHRIKVRRIMREIAPYSRTTFYRWRMLQLDDKAEIPLSKQVVIANILDCTVDELANTTKTEVKK